MIEISIKKMVYFEILILFVKICDTRTHTHIGIIYNEYHNFVKVSNASVLFSHFLYNGLLL